VVFSIVRRKASDKLVKESTQGVIVYSKGVTSTKDHFRRHILSRSTIRKGLGASIDFLREAEVDNLAVAIRINEDVLGFEIAIQDGLGVKILDAIENLQEVELGSFLAHHLDLLEQVEELSSGTI
jgi:hypothetical protein